ncbi:adenylyl-sulfate kinase [Marinigracilibium pacificum]|uniref:Adenylyl-sulfate kinase n=1 Tax=Marinigracilibium pacificum TaxID=2729599 RepID=A0A848IXW2_9BACT|nr:adenylyl-sulfate kinase [Marinigracilibium pacificum]NMM46809.1 adenylyl-sulfate kinase [Marinigracilibium pacificum]
MAENIHPIFETILSKVDKENLLEQRGVVIWMVGLSGSGKSTLARGLEKRLHNEGILTMLLDGDNLRTGINKNLGFSDEDRTENIRRAAEVSKLFSQCGIVTICSLISPTNSIRKMAKEIIGEDSYLEVFVNASIEECEKRDVKGLYAKARAGEIKSFTGIDSPFEAPSSPFLEIITEGSTIEESLDKLTNSVYPKIKSGN